MPRSAEHSSAPTLLYTPEQRVRRDATVWTLVQGILAPLQFLACLVSLVLVLRFLTTGAGYEAATASIIVKTILLLTIMITGAIWEKVVFGQYLFAPAFFWEDVVSFGVIALHLVYVAALLTGFIGPTGQMAIALKLENGVYHMFQNFWTRKQSILSDMPHQKNRCIGFLGELHQLKSIQNLKTLNQNQC